ncbi:MAG: P-loop NTPase fold protein [Chthoniobacterales bacterium]
MIKADHPSRTADELDRAPLAKRIKDVIANLRPDDQGFTISIEGRWGDGKSWIINKLKTELGASAQVVELNPWLVGNRASLLTEFFSCLSSQLKDTTATNLKKLMSSYAKRLSKAAQGAGNEYVAVAGSIAVAALREKSELESLADLRLQLADQLKLLTRKIVVAVDDIDRLASAEVVEVIRLIKAVGELPNVVYVIALDPEYVESALRTAGHGEYDNYLDKIIQLRVAVPPLRYPQKWKLLQQQLDRYWDSDMMHKSPGGQEACKFRLNHLAQPIAKLIENPRDVVRVWNRFLFVEAKCQGEVNPIDLLALQAIYIKAPKLYEAICRLPRQFTHSEKSDSNLGKKLQPKPNKAEEPTKSEDIEKTKQKDLEILLMNKSGVLSAAICKLTFELFPAFLYDFHRPSNKQTGHLDNLLILQVALNAGGLEEQWTLDEINSLLFKPEIRLMLLEKCNSYERSVDLYGQLDERVSQFEDIVSPLDLIQQLSSIKFKVKSFRGNSQVADLVRKWAEFLDNKERRGKSKTKTAAELMVESFEVLLKSPDFSDAYQLLSAEHHYKNTQGGSNYFEDGDLTKALEKFATKLLNKLDNDELIVQEQGAQMLRFLYSFNPIIFGKISENQTRFEKWFLVNQNDCVKHQYSGGQTVSFHKIEQDYIDKFGGEKIIIPYLNTIENRGNLTQSELALIKAFKNPGLMFDPTNAMQLHESDV